MKKDTVLFGKYKLLKRIGSGRTGTVWQAYHLGLEEYRAVKIVAKSQGDYETFRREALVLKELRHPGIPLVYDLEEDEHNFYLIEEYLEGYSLYARVTERGTLLKEEAVRYGLQLCSLVDYMHSAWKEPILHLDIQPKNLILTKDTIRLIDFEHAAGAETAGNLRQRYGTIGCAAPEQYTTDRLLDQRTDVYAIGAVLRFMLRGSLSEGEGQSEDPDGLEGIIERCMEPDMEKRYASAGEAAGALERLYAGKKLMDHVFDAAPSHNIILTGTRPGAGTTHLAFSLCRYLDGRGYKVLYEECSPSRAVLTLALAERLRPDSRGIYRIRGCFMKPWYGPAVKLPGPEGFQIIIRDFGTGWQEAGRELKSCPGVLIAAACISPWEQGQPEDMLEELSGDFKGAVLALRHMTRKRFAGFGGIRGLEGEFKTWLLRERIPVLGIPDYEDPFHPGREGRGFLKALWEEVEGRQKRK